MKKENIRGLREGAMMVALSAVLALATKYVPLFSFIGTFVCCIPLAVLAIRNNFKVLIPSVVAAFLVLIMIDGNLISATSTLLMSYIPGVVAGYMMGKQKPFFYTLFITAFAVCFGWIFELVMLKVLMNSSIDQLLAESMKQFEAIMLEVYKNVDTKFTETLKATPEEFVKSTMNATVAVIKLYFPSMVVVSSLITAYIIIRVSGFVARRTRLANIFIPIFSMLKSPRSMSTVAVIFYFVYIFMGNNSIIWSVIANIVFILYTLIGICGLSVIDFKLTKKVSSPIIRFCIYAAVFIFGGVFISLITNILIIIGILDAGRDFRHIDNGIGSI